MIFSTWQICPDLCPKPPLTYTHSGSDGRRTFSGTAPAASTAHSGQKDPPPQACRSVSGGKHTMHTPTDKRRKIEHLLAVRYRLPLPVTKVLVLLCGNSYPLCPRCDCTLDREYMCYCDRCGQCLSWELFEHAKTVYAPRTPQ